MEIEETDCVFPPKLRILYGIAAIILGIISLMVTYKYVIPIGSIFLIGSGLTLIFWKRWNHMVRNIIVKYIHVNNDNNVNNGGIK